MDWQTLCGSNVSVEWFCGAADVSRSAAISMLPRRYADLETAEGTDKKCYPETTENKVRLLISLKIFTRRNPATTRAEWSPREPAVVI
jgi:hypothetical protein